MNSVIDIMAIKPVFSGASFRMVAFQQAGQKKKKDRVTVMMTANADGSDKTKLWFVGKAKQPRAFRRAGINPSSTSVKWEHNSTAWWNTKIMIDYLRWFDELIGRTPNR